MRKKIIRVLFFIFVSINCYGQNFSVKNLISLCNKTEWETVNRFLISKGWDYDDSQIGPNDQSRAISWAFKKQNFNGNAQAWFALYTNNGNPCKIEYTVYNRGSFTIIQNSIYGAGFKLTSSEINDNEIVTKYDNSLFILRISSKKTIQDDDFQTNITVYEVVLIKKSSVYDPENGVKYKYYKDGQIKSVYKLKNGKINGELKKYYDNGNLQLNGNYINGKGNGFFVEYDSLGNISAKYIEVDDKIDGILTLYQNGLKYQEISVLNGIFEGGFTIYYYDESNNVKYKVVGNNENGKMSGKITTKMLVGNNEIEVGYDNYRDGMKNGDSKHYLNSDTLEYKQFKNDTLNGLYRREIKVVPSEKDSINNELFWNIDCEGAYKDGLKNGHWKFYLFGTLTQEGNYLDGKKQGKWFEYVIWESHHGEKSSEIQYINDERNGLSKAFFDFKCIDTVLNGIKGVSCHSIPITELVYYKSDQRDGEYILRDSIGNLKVKGYYSSGEEDRAWTFYNSDSSFAVADYSKGQKLSAKYYNPQKELYLKELYNNGILFECDYYKDTALIETHLIKKNDDGYRVVVMTNASSKQDTITSCGYVINSKDEYTYKLFSNLGKRDGEYKLLVKNETIVEGSYCEDKKCGYWIFEYPKSNVYSTKLYANDTLMEEKFYYNKSRKIFNGKLDIINSGLRYVIKIKKGLRNGKTSIFNMEGLLVGVEVYKSGVRIKT